MILYDYRCPKHGYFEAWRGIEEIIIPCPDCGKESKRYPGLPAVITASGGPSLPGTPWRGRCLTGERNRTRPARATQRRESDMPHKGRRIKIGKFVSGRAKAGTPLKKQTRRVARLGRK